MSEVEPVPKGNLNFVSCVMLLSLSIFIFITRLLVLFFSIPRSSLCIRDVGPLSKIEIADILFSLSLGFIYVAFPYM